jgi:hypothetical protein
LAATTFFGILFLFFVSDALSHYNYQHHRFAPFSRHETEGAPWVGIALTISAVAYTCLARSMKSKK